MLQRLSLFSFFQTIQIKPQRGSHRKVALRTGRKISRNDMLKQNGVAFAVRQIRKTAQTVRHRMHCAQDRIGEGQSGVHAGQHDLGAVIDVFWIIDRKRQISMQETHRFQSVQIGQWPVYIGNVSLYRMR